MIGTIDIQIQAHNPNFPLDPVFTYKDSPQSFRIRNVPKKIGKWEITKVFVDVSYPDNSTASQECVLTGGVWVGTVEGCSTSGSCEKGFVVTACGYDEYGTSITGYVLGVGDVYVKDFDGSISPGSNASKMYFYETTPTAPKKGDVCFQNGIMVVWNGTSWEKSFDDSFLNFKRDKTDLQVYEYSPWSISKYQQYMGEMNIYDPPIEFEWITIELESGETMSLWITKLEVLPDTYLAVDGNAEHVYELVHQSEYMITHTYVPTIDSDKTHITALIYRDETSECEISRSVVEQLDRLAKLSEIPTSLDKIQDSSRNVINANRTVSYYVVSYHWKLYDGFENEYDFTGTKTNSAWQSGSDKMKLFMPDSSHWTLQRFFDLGGTWITSWSETIEGSEDDNGMIFLDHGFSCTWFDTYTITSDELTLKSYVDAQIGQVLTEEV